jgi:cell fate regulator YaaT (PSP1 superfamily)
MSQSDSSKGLGPIDHAAPQKPAEAANPSPADKPSDEKRGPIPITNEDVEAHPHFSPDLDPDVPDEITDLGEVPRPRQDDHDGGIFELDQAAPQEAVDPAAVVEIPPESPAAEPAPAEPDDAALPTSTNRVVVRYGLMRQVGEFRHNLSSPPHPGRKLVIRSERGVELGEVLMPLCDGEDAESSSCRQCSSGRRVADFIHASGPEYPYRRDGKILRVANAQDVDEQRHLDTSAREEATFARQHIREMKLDMRLVTVEHLLGGERIIFYFSSETRVDFRDLVRLLATQFRTRIEMRQVGARDEARLVADYERCGQRCCCQQFLKDLKPVSMRMAKTQKATLDPSKISGRCGRLMCCLRYEDVGYEELRKKLPRKNTWVQTAAGVVGKVVDGQIITQLVRLWLVDNTQVVVPNEEIQARDVPAPPMPTFEERRARPERKEKGPPRLLREQFTEAPPAGAAAAAPESFPAQDADTLGRDATDAPPADASAPQELQPTGANGVDAGIDAGADGAAGDNVTGNSTGEAGDPADADPSASQSVAADSASGATQNPPAQPPRSGGGGQNNSNRPNSGRPQLGDRRGQGQGQNQGQRRQQGRRQQQGQRQQGQRPQLGQGQQQGQGPQQGQGSQQGQGPQQGQGAQQGQDGGRRRRRRRGRRGGAGGQPGQGGGGNGGQPSGDSQPGQGGQGGQGGPPSPPPA